MKLFNWVHKKFHHDPLPKDHEFGQKVGKNSDELLHSNDKDTQALLEKVVLIDALDGWKDGIFAIGTFGFDPLKPFNQQYSQKEYLVLESEQEDDEDEAESQEFSVDEEESDDEDEEETCAEDEEVNPLMLSALGHSFKEVITSEKSDQHVLLSLDGISLASKDQELAAQVNQSLQSEEKKKAGRTTLADLFLADGDVKMKMESGKVLAEESIPKKMNVRTKKSLSFAKKLIPRVKEEASPIKNIQRLMRRMLKRKIHPEALDAKMNKSEGQKSTGGIELVTNTPQKASESVSLLAMQGITI